MNAQEKAELEAQIASYRSLDLASSFAAWYPQQADLSAIHFSNNNYTAATFIAISKHFVDALDELLKTEHWHIVPRRRRDTTPLYELVPSFQRFVTLSNTGHLDQAGTELDRLVQFAMIMGFWRAPGQKAAGRVDTRTIETQLNASAKRLGLQLDTIQKASSDLDDRRQDLTKFIDERRTEFEEIRRMVAAAKNDLNSMSAVLAEAEGKKEAIKAIETEGKTTQAEMKVQVETVRRTVDELKGENLNLAKELREHSELSMHNVEQSKAGLQETEELRKEILGYRDAIKRYVGLSVDGYLGNKFDARAKRMRWGLWIWGAAIPFAVGVAIFWAVYVFQHFSTTGAIDWLTFGLNLLKTSPAFILLGFVFGQYIKERNLREEYAFKGAVAMTVNTYAELLAGQDREDNKSRQELILNALRIVHLAPRLHSERGGRILGFRSKELRETLASLNDTLTSLRPK